MVKTVGFTDEVPVTSPSLIQDLLADVLPDLVPEPALERRLFLNQRLSEFRARTVNEYAVEQLHLLDQGTSVVAIDTDIVGKGEALPTKEDVTPPYLTRDPRRRVCKISVTFRREPLPFMQTTAP